MRPALRRARPQPRRHPRAPSRAACSPSATTSACCPNTSSPNETGRDYTLSPYLELLKEHRNDFTVFSGVSHPDVDGGHPADNCFLTAAPHPGSGGFRNTISLDQYIAERIGHLTRFPSLTLGVNVQQRPAQPFLDRLRRAHPLRGKGLRRLQAHVPPGHAGRGRGPGPQARARRRASSTPSPTRPKTCSATSARATATGSTSTSPASASSNSAWRCPANGNTSPSPPSTPAVPLDPASPREYMEKVRLMYDMARLAFETDSTRCITLLLDSVNSPAIEHRRREDHRRLSQPLPPRQIRSQARAAQGHRRMAHEAAGRTCSPSSRPCAKTATPCSTAR